MLKKLTASVAIIAMVFFGAVRSQAQVNIATNGTAGNDGLGTWGGPDSKINDGVWAWDSANGIHSDGDQPTRLWITWTNDYIIDGVELWHCEAGTTYCSADYQIQSLNAGGNATVDGDWTTVLSVTGNTSINPSHSFASVKTAGIRLYITDDGPQTPLRFEEMLVYGELAPNGPTFSALSASNVTTTSVTFNATLETAATNADVYAHWWQSGGSTNSDYVGSWTNVASTNISFSTNGLSSGTLYYYAFNATNASTNIWSATNSFGTAGAPTVDTAGGATGIDIGEATLNGRVVSTGGYALTHVRIYFGDEDGGATTNWDTNYMFTASSVTQGVAFTATASNLLYGIEYSYRTYASNSYGENWSAVANFTTLRPETGFWQPVTNSLVVHFDAGAGVTHTGGSVTEWEDQSDNGHTATKTAGTMTLVEDEINGHPVVTFTTDGTYADLAGSLYIKQQFMVFNLLGSGNWGTVIGSGQQSGYLLNPNGTFWGSNYPEAVRENGGADKSSGIDLSNGSYIVVRITGNDNDTSVRSGWRMGRQQGWDDLHMKLAEVIGYDTALSSEDENLVGDYLAQKYGITTDYSGYSPIPDHSITNDPAITITDTGATLTGRLDGYESVFNVYLYWSTNATSTNAANWLADSTASNVVVGAYTNVTGQPLSQSISGLTPGETYYFTFMATNAATNIWADTLSFVADGSPEVENGAASSYITYAVMRGNMLATNGGPTTAIIYWGKTDGDTNAAAWDYTNNLGVTEVGPFSETVYNLDFNTTYYFRCYATNAYGESWATSSVQFAQLRPVYVDADATGANNGTSWTDAYTTFQSGLTAVNTDTNTIWIAEGTYSGVIFQPSVNGTTIYGGFDGTETSLLQRDWTNNPVLLDGQSTRRVMEVKALDVILDGLVITNGYLAAGDGAGIVVDDGVATAADLTIANCRITECLNYDLDNIAGGAYFLNAGTVMITNCVIQRNYQRRGNGSGFYSRGTTLTIVDSEIRENRDWNGDYRDGHGFYLYDGTLTMLRTTVADNTPPSTDNANGAGGYINSGTASFTHCLFTGNNIKNGDGGGLYINSGDVTIENCTFADNGGNTGNSQPEGGALYINNADVTVKNSIFFNNTAGNDGTDGDSIYLAGGTLTITYSSFGEGLSSPAIQLMGGTYNPGAGLFTNDPLFVSSTDYHLKSTLGHWDGAGWVPDGEHSPCIDRGDGTSDYSQEPFNADGGRINLGAYGGRPEASKSGAASQPAVETRTAQVFVDKAKLRGELTLGSVSDITFYYGLSNESTNAASWGGTATVSVAYSPGTIFDADVIGLETNTTYYFTVFASNDYGTAWGDVDSFLTGTNLPTGGGPTILHVDADATGFNDGTSWTNAYTQLADAISAAGGSKMTIWIADGTYSHWNAFAPATNGLAIYGGFDGTETNLTERDWTNNIVLLDGQSTRRVMEVQALDVILDGLIITNGYNESGSGAGLVVDDGVTSAANLTMANCRIVECLNYQLDQDGGGAYFLNAGTVLITNCIIQGNHQRRGEGSGFYSRGTTLTFIDSELRDNYDWNSDYRNGQGFYMYDGTLTMLGSTVKDNTSPYDDNAPGAGGYIRDGTAAFTNCVFIGNNIKRGDGGALYIERSSANVTIENCTFADNGGTTNSAEPEGGAIYQADGTVTIKNSIFWDNQAGNDGSDGDTIYQAAGTLNISYTCMDGTNSPRVQAAGGTLNWGSGIITNDPFFVTEYIDVHLRSAYGRWTASGLTYDYLTSPCIDVGDPASTYSSEPDSPAGQINMGAYGNTVQASYGISNSPPIVSNDPGAIEGITIATIRGTLMSTGGLPTTVWTYWGTSDGVMDTNNWDYVITNDTFDADGVFSNALTNVYYGVDYYYRVAASNSEGMAWATNTAVFSGTLTVDDVFTNNVLKHNGYHASPPSLLDLDNNGGMVDTNSNPPWGTAWFTDGPSGRGLDFDNDTDFINAGAVNQVDNYQNLFFGHFFPPVTGTYEFQRYAQDDYTGIWIDLDRDGVFESTTSGLGSDRGEQLAYNDAGLKSVSLTNGLSYMVAFTHGEGAGGSQIDIRFKTPLMGSHVKIKPADVDQDGYWKYLTDPEFVLPTGLTNASVTNIQETSAYCNVDYLGTASVFNVRFYYGTSNGGSNSAAWAATNFVGSYTNVASASLSTNITSLTADTTYYGIFNAATPNSVTSLWSDVVTFGTAFQAGDAPSNLTATAVGLAIELTWQAETVDSESGFVIQSSPNDTSSFTDLYIVGADATNFTDTLGIGGTTYYYRVAATNLSGLSNWSNTNNAVMPSLPADIFVTTNGTHPTGPSWQYPTSLTNALAIATTSNVIWMAEGNYTNSSTFTIATDGLEIYGGFEVGATTTTNRDLTAHATLLDGNALHAVVDVQADDVLLDGLVITNGFAPSANGAGLRMNDTGTGLTMLNCRVVGNWHSWNDRYGAGAWFYNAGNVLVSNCAFNGNWSDERAKGVGFASQGTTTLTVQDCEIRDNYATGDERGGKGFWLQSGTLIMTGTTIADNYEATDDDSGPGVGGYINSGTAAFTNCIFTGNIATRSDGAGLYVNNGNVTIENCTFANNTARTDHSSPEGGAIYQNNGTVTIKNSIFWDNQAGNDATDGDTIYQSGGTLNISYSCLDGIDLPRVRFINGSWGDGIITNDPLFATDYTDVHLKSTVGRWNGSSWVTDVADSPCIDTGDPASDYSNEPTGTNGARINMGAYANTWQASKSTDEAPVVETQAARVVANAAELKGLLTTGSVSTITFYYGLTDQGETATGWAGTNVLSEGQSVGNVFSSVAGGLQETQTYVFRVYATNAFGDDWSETNSFTTGVATPGGGTGVIHVDADAVGVQDGLSWTNAFTALEDALSAADAGLGTNIWIAQGSYSWQGEAFVIQTNGLHVYGGFDATETLLSARDWTNNIVLLDGQAMSLVVDIQADDVLLDGLIITNGYEEFANGAGIRMDQSGTDLTLLNCRVVGNHHKYNDRYGGGAFFYTAGNVLMSNCVFEGNWSDMRGHGVGFYSRDTTLTLLDSEIRANYSTGDQRYGKGFYLYDGTLTMVGTTVADNWEGSDDNSGTGGGGYIRAGTAMFTNCVFTGNQLTRSDGAGLYVYSGNVTIESCTFANNGGRTDNTEPEGGAIYLRSGTMTITNSIFWDNQTGSEATDGDTIYQEGGILTIGYSCLDGTNAPRVQVAGGTLTWGSGIITNNPLFAADYTDVHLQSEYGRWSGGVYVFDPTNSPCIDTGDPASDYSSEATPNGGQVNMGAYGNTAEASLSQHPVVISTYNGATNVAWTNATLMGELVSTGAAPTYVWFYYGTNNATTNKAGWDTNVYLDATAVGVFSNTIGGLQANQTYWYTAYGSNSLGDAWAGAPRNFTTFDAAAINNTNGALLTKVGEALLRGNLTAGGQCDVTVYWGTADGGTSASSWQNTNVISAVDEGAFSTNVSGLLYGVYYYYRCYATNQLGDAWAGSTESFTTLKFPALTVTNDLELWLAGDDIDGDGETNDNPAHAAAIDTWYDKSGNGRNAYRAGTDQTSYNTNGPNGKPVVAFDGDYMYTTYNFDSLSEYTVFLVAHYASGGTHERILSSNTRDWRFGYDAANDGYFYAQGTIHSVGSDNTNWHVHAGHINSDADPKASFWKDGVLLTSDDTGSDNTNYKPGQLGLGGYRTDNDESDCEIAEVLIFGRVLTGTELDEVGSYLDAKYNFSTGYDVLTDLRDLGIANQPATNVQDTTAVINADLTATGAVLDVWAYWGLVNENEDPNAWTYSALVGSYTNVNCSLSYTVSNLVASSTYSYTFRATNMFEDTWGSPPIYSLTSTATGSQAIANAPATAVTNSSATANAILRIPYATYTVYVHWGQTDGSTDVGSWTSSDEVGTFTNVAFTNLSHQITGLRANKTHWYTFRCSNSLSTVWATPSYEFVTLRSATGSVFMFK